MHFTTKEFDKMVQEVLFEKESHFEMLYLIAKKNLTNSIKWWCSCNKNLRGLEEDVFNEVFIRLMQCVVDRFLLKDGRTVENYNNDPQGFSSWMHTVARRLVIDKGMKLGAKNVVTDDIDDPNRGELQDPHNFIEENANREILQESLETVLSSNRSVYKILTWLAHFVFMLCEVDTRIRSNKLIIEKFENRTLNEMYEMIIEASDRIPWLVITSEQNERIKKALQKKRRDSDVTYGESIYKDFYMKKDGEPDAIKSISDWTNRMDEIVRGEKEKPEKGGEDKKKKSSQDEKREEKE